VNAGEFDALSEIDGVEGGKKKMQGGRGGAGAGNKALTFEQVSRHFSMPIMQAARELNVGLTVLKKRCRKLGIPRWPHRKVRSLQTLITSVQVLLPASCHLHICPQSAKFLGED
jgi:hypothetical protein